MTMSWSPSIGAAGPRPLYLEIAKAIEADVLAGRLRPGDRLPPHRDLARQLGVTVGTISRGYTEARRAGWISGEVGRGTFVLDRRAGRFPSRTTEDDRGRDLVDLSLNIPVDTPAPDLGAALRAVAGRESVQALLRYPPPQGSRGDREAGAAVLERHGLSVDAEEVVPCAGALHGLGVALEAVTRPGDCVLAEELTFPSFRPLAEARGLRVLALAMDEHGIVPGALEAACRKAQPKALYVIPTLHNPTTGTLSAERRAELAAIARRNELFMIEDDVYRMLDPTAPPPIATFARERTVYVAALSKCFVPGLRIGYITGPPALRSRLHDAVWHSICAPSPIAMALATHWVRSGELDEIAAAKRAEMQARQAIASELLPRGSIRTAPAAYHLWLSTGTGSAEAFALEARARGVGVTPGTAFFLGSGSPPAAVRISLSAAPDRSALATAFERLRGLLERSPGSPAVTL